MEDVYKIIYVKFVLCTIGIFIHSIGIYALTKMRRKSNQVMILLSLSVSEMLILASFAVGAIVGRICYEEKNYDDSTTFDDFRPGRS